MKRSRFWLWSFAPVAVLFSLVAQASRGEIAQQAAGPLVDLLPPAPESASFVWGDYDADGLQDAYVITPTGEGRLLRNLGDGTLEDVTQAAGLEAVLAPRLVLWGDYDADGHADLYVGTGLGSHHLFRNQGAGVFEDAAEAAGIAHAGIDRRAGWLDYDRDGLVDLHVRTQRAEHLYHNLGDGLFERVELSLPTTPGTLTGLTTGVTGTLVGPPAADQAGALAPAPAASSPDDLSARPSGGARPSELSSTSSTGSSSAPLGPVPGNFAGAMWASAIEDQDNPGWSGVLQASSYPTLGMLYPLSSSLFVTTSGRVGIGTTSPLWSQLHVKSFGVDSALRLEGTGTGGLGGKLVFGASDTSTYISEVEEDGIYVVADEGVGMGPGNVGIHVNNLAEATHALTVKTDGASNDVLRLIGASGSFGHGAELNFGDGDYVKISEDVDDHLLISARQGTKLTTAGIVAAPALEITQSYGSGTSSPTLKLDNSSVGAGIALFAETYGSDANTVLTQHGTGSVLRGFVGGQLKFEMRNNGRMVARSVEITGGSDLVESFDADVEVEPGTVLCIDPDNPGRLTPSKSAYDTRVAGVVSGAGGVNPGLHLRQEGVTDGAVPVAMAGRVYVRCTTENGAIVPGDRLTTSDLEGYAMKVTDAERSIGTVIGKAMTSLEEGSGLVLVLVNLQ